MEVLNCCLLFCLESGYQINTADIYHTVESPTQTCYLHTDLSPTSVMTDISTAVKTGYVVTHSILLLLSLVLSEPLRTRRQESQQYFIDTLVVVDNIMFSRFQQWLDDWSSRQGNESRTDVKGQVKEYVAHVFHQANNRLGTLDQNLGHAVRLQVVNVIINLDILGNASLNFGGEVPSDKAIEVFRSWVQGQQYGDKYDHAVLLTGRNLTGEVFSRFEVIKGRSFTRHMCNRTGYSTSVVQDTGGFQSAFYLTHEIGHSLGADHDSLNQNGCLQDRYIMTADMKGSMTQENVVHPWYFSACSVTQIETFIGQITSLSSLSGQSQLPNCLNSSSEPIAEFKATLSVNGGQQYPADVQCQMMHGNLSRVCLSNGFPNLDQICTSMCCLDPTWSGNDSRCIEYFAADGTSCGDRKLCKLGRCVTSAEAPSIDTTKCPNGDSCTKINGQECSVVIKNNPMLCYNETVRSQFCCKSCKGIKRDSEVCPYGDRIEGCKKESCNRLDGCDYAENCCGTCSYDKPPGCTDISIIDGVTCEIRVKLHGLQECYNCTVADSCCHTCSKSLTSQPDCKYGDYFLDGTCASVKENPQICEDEEQGLECCYSCSTVNSGAVVNLIAWPFSIIVLLFIFYENGAMLI